MLPHLFKLIWNKKKQNFLLITEILVSFIVIFAVFALLVYFYQNYKKPIGIEYENVWAVKFSQSGNAKYKDSLTVFYENIGHMLHSIPQIKHASFTSGNSPFVPNTSNNMVTYNKLNTVANFYVVQDDYAEVLGLKMKEGRWFDKTDNAHKDRPVVINESLNDLFFKNEKAVGKKLGQGPDAMEVIGVVNDFKDKGDFMQMKTGIFRRMDTSMYDFVSTILINVQPNTDAAFESKLFKTLSTAIGSSIEIVHLTSQRKAINSIALVPMIILFIVAGFLILNVALGLFGVLWYNINKRKSEIGLRRAVGASGSAVSKQMVGEALVLSTISLIVGSFFAIQFPLLNIFDLSANIYLIALAFAILFIYMLVIICALYPAKQAAAIFPADSLHED